MWHNLKHTKEILVNTMMHDEFLKYVGNVAQVF